MSDYNIIFDNFSEGNLPLFKVILMSFAKSAVCIIFDFQNESYVHFQHKFQVIHLLYSLKVIQMIARPRTFLNYLLRSIGENLLICLLS